MVEALRASPQRLASVVEFPDVVSFVEQDQRRGLADWPNREDAGGVDLGIYWRLENSFRRWETTTWRISWLSKEATYRNEDHTDEIYAIEFPGRLGLETGRVWLLGTLHTRSAVDRALDDLRVYAIGERNSVAAAAAAVAAVMKEENVKPSRED